MGRLGILGGSFDPIHRGHLQMAANARDAYDLDEVWLIPAGHSPNKEERHMTAADHRFFMCELAASGEPRIKASRFEIDCPERSYTYRTLERLKEQYPGDELFFIMGGDSLDYFECWVKPEVICALATILVIPRDQFDTWALREKIRRLKERFSCEIGIVPCSRIPLSSTQLREKLRRGEAAQEDFPPGVFEYIQKNGLYRGMAC